MTTNGPTIAGHIAGKLTASVADEIRAQVANLHRPAPDCGLGIVECIQQIEAERQTAPEDDIVTDPVNQYRMGSADGWNGAMDMVRSALLAHGYTASPDQEGDQ